MKGWCYVLEYVTKVIKFPKAAYTTEGPQLKDAFFNFSRNVKKAIVGFSKISFGFTDGEDHHLGTVIYSLDTAIDKDTVTVRCKFGLRDWSGDWDDPYEGEFEISLIVEFEDEGKSNLSIVGVEHSQGIQFFNSTLGTKAEPNNHLSIIKNKPLVLRVYTNTEINTGLPSITEIKGELEYTVDNLHWLKAIPINETINPIQSKNINRINSDDTLNFLIPGSELSNNLSYRVRVFDTAHPDNKEYSSENHFGSIPLVATKNQRIYVIGINYSGNNQNLAAPRVVDLQGNLGFLRMIYPLNINNIVITGYTTINFSGNLSLSNQWDELLKLIKDHYTGNALCLGILPNGVINPAHRGISYIGGGCALAPVNETETIAHEIGHACGAALYHVKGCGNPASPYTDLDYGLANTASIGEVGIDPTGKVYDPTNWGDIMSYCTNWRWISPLHYQCLINEFYYFNVPYTMNYDKENESQTESNNKMVMDIRIYTHTKKVKIFSTYIYPMEEINQIFGEKTPYNVLLLDCEENILCHKRLYNNNNESDLDSIYIDFRVIIPHFPTASKFMITCGEYGSCSEKCMFTKAIINRNPIIKILYPTGGETLSGNVTLKWSSSMKNDNSSYLVQYSSDNGENFINISPSLKETEYTVNFDNMSGSDNAVIKIISSTGLGSSSTITKPFYVPIKPREATIIKPNNNATYSYGKIIEFIGDNFSADFPYADYSELIWRSDKDGIIGYGNQIFNLLTVGEHFITLKSPDGIGGETSDSVKITITGSV